MSLADAFAAIDDANREDPQAIVFDGESWALAHLQGVRASHWLTKLSDASAPPVSTAVSLAARAHHLRRWTVVRSDYPEGRGGYHRWKRDAKRAHADGVAELCVGHVDDATIVRAQEFVQRIGLGSDPETQLIEDCACLVFLETQFEPLIDKIGRDKVVDAVRKTITKMSPEAIALAPLAIRTPLGADVLAEAAAATS